MGGPVGLGEIDIVLIERSELETAGSAFGGQGGASEIVIRFPTGSVLVCSATLSSRQRDSRDVYGPTARPMHS